MSTFSEDLVFFDGHMHDEAADCTHDARSLGCRVCCLHPEDDDPPADVFDTVGAVANGVLMIVSAAAAVVALYLTVRVLALVATALAVVLR